MCNAQVLLYSIYLITQIVLVKTISLGLNKSVVRGSGIPNYSNAKKEQSACVFIQNQIHPQGSMFTPI